MSQYCDYSGEEKILFVAYTKLKLGVIKKKEIVLIITDRRFAFISKDVGLEKHGLGFLGKMSDKLIKKEKNNERYYNQPVSTSLSQHPENFFVQHKDITSISLFLGKRGVIGSTTSSSSTTTLEFVASQGKQCLIFDDVSINSALNTALESIYGKIAIRDSKWI